MPGQSNPPLPSEYYLAQCYVDDFIKNVGYTYKDEDGISDRLRCPICSEPFTTPMLLSSCPHLFCSPCIREWLQAGQDTCPVCRLGLSPSNLAPAPRIVQEMVDDIPVICSLGCGARMDRGAWPEHLEKACKEVEVDGVRRGDIFKDSKEDLSLPRAIEVEPPPPENSGTTFAAAPSNAAYNPPVGGASDIGDQLYTTWQAWNGQGSSTASVNNVPAEASHIPGGPHPTNPFASFMESTPNSPTPGARQSSSNAPPAGGLHPHQTLNGSSREHEAQVQSLQSKLDELRTQLASLQMSQAEARNGNEGPRMSGSSGSHGAGAGAGDVPALPYSIRTRGPSSSAWSRFRHMRATSNSSIGTTNDDSSSSVEQAAPATPDPSGRLKPNTSTTPAAGPFKKPFKFFRSRSKSNVGVSGSSSPMAGSTSGSGTGAGPEHEAWCDLCPGGNSVIRGTRYKCLSCYDFDACQNCYKNSVPTVHPLHTFAVFTEPVEVYYPDHHWVEHTDVGCDACGMSPIRGLRYECSHPSCGGQVDFCANCVAKPVLPGIPPLHPKDHRLLRVEYRVGADASGQTS